MEGRIVLQSLRTYLDCHRVTSNVPKSCAGKSRPRALGGCTSSGAKVPCTGSLYTIDVLGEGWDRISITANKTYTKNGIEVAVRHHLPLSLTKAPAMTRSIH